MDLVGAVLGEVARIGSDSLGTPINVQMRGGVASSVGYKLWYLLGEQVGWLTNHSNSPLS